MGIQSNQKEVFMSGIKKYILTIEYNTDTEEIEYIQEEVVDDDPIIFTDEDELDIEETPEEEEEIEILDMTKRMR